MRGVILLGCTPKVGKTYCARLLIDAMLRHRQQVGYFKFAATGVSNIEQSEAAYILEHCRVNQELSEMLPYTLKGKGPVHLQARREQHFLSEARVTERFAWNLATHSMMVVEGVGEVVSPLIMERDQVLLQEDLIFKMQLGVILIVKMSASALNESVLAVNYLKSIGKSPLALIINGYDQRNYAHRDALSLIERCTQTPILALVATRQVALKPQLDLHELFAEHEVEFDLD